MKKLQSRIFQLRKSWLLYREVTTTFEHDDRFFGFELVEEHMTGLNLSPTIFHGVDQQNRTNVEILGFNFWFDLKNRVHESHRNFRATAQWIKRHQFGKSRVV
jgi:hypothetical protein